MNDAIAASVNALVAHLATIPGLAVRVGFPAPNVKLVMPALSVLELTPEFTNLQPYELEKSEPDEDNQTSVKRVVGNYEIPLQLDLWCRNRLEAQRFGQLVFEKMNPDLEPMGLRLQLASYHNLWASFTITGIEEMQDEAMVQRQEWRTRLSVTCSCKAVLVKDEFAIITIENQLSTPDNIT